MKNAQTLADALVDLGYAIVSGGTDTHLMLVDLRPKNLTGKSAEKTLGEAGITVNKNTVPDDPQSPFVTSGIRLGTPALTTRGMGTGEMLRVAQLIDEALTHPDEKTLSRVRREVGELTSAFPLYQPAKLGRPACGEARERRKPAPPDPPMNELQFADDVLARIRARGGRYHERGYLFVLATIEYLQSRLEVRRHVNGAELAWACRDFAREQFGLLAPHVLAHWGITRTEDFGRIVFTLVESRPPGHAAGRSRGRFRRRVRVRERLRRRLRMAWRSRSVSHGVCLRVTGVPWRRPSGRRARSARRER